MPRRSRSYSRSRSRSYDRDRWSRSPPSRRRGGGRRNEYDYPPNTQIYIARFSRRTRESDLRRAFEKYGRVISVDVKYHGCFAFIVYDDPREAQDAIDDMNGRCLPYENDRLVVEQAGANKRRRRSPSRRSPRRGPISDDICYNCNGTGHWAADCREETVSKSREIREGRCFSCGEKGHKRADCQDDRGGGHSRRRRSYSRGRSSSAGRSRSRSPKRHHRRYRSRSNEHRRSKHSDRRDSAIEKTSRRSGERQSRQSRDKGERNKSRERRDERSISADAKDTARSGSKDTFKSASPPPRDKRKRSKSASKNDPPRTAETTKV